MRYKDRTVRTVGQLVQALKAQTAAGRTIWFRGHATASWKLVPGLARNKNHLVAEGAILKRFMQDATPHLTKPVQEEWEWMFLMQHYRAATRLLDWTESPLAALYFAVEDVKRDRSDALVWCLDPLKLNAQANLVFPFAAEIPAFGKDSVLDSYLPSRVADNPASLGVSPSSGLEIPPGWRHSSVSSRSTIGSTFRLSSWGTVAMCGGG